MRSDEAVADRPGRAGWRKSSFSGENGCVVIGPSIEGVRVRDAKLGAAGPVLVFPVPAWAEFTGTLR